MKKLDCRLISSNELNSAISRVFSSEIVYIDTYILSLAYYAVPEFPNINPKLRAMGSLVIDQRFLNHFCDIVLSRKVYL